MPTPASAPVTIRPVEQQDLPQADRVFRLAFGTAARLPEPLAMFGDAGYMHRWSLSSGQAFAAVLDGQLVGTNFLTRWGSLGSFGPLTVHPDYWNQGIAAQLMATTMEQFDQWQTPAVAFFTSSHSPKHLWFYSKFGFVPGCLTTVLTKNAEPETTSANAVQFSDLTPAQRHEALRAAQALTDSIHAGLNLGAEIRLVFEQQLGETLLLWEDAGLGAVAICHFGPNTEGGSDNLYVKFAAAQLGKRVQQRFEALLDACETLAVAQQLGTITAGVNTSRYDAYQRMLARGFNIRLIGVAMHQPPQRDYCRPDAYVLDDRR